MALYLKILRKNVLILRMPWMRITAVYGIQLYWNS